MIKFKCDNQALQLYVAKPKCLIFHQILRSLSKDIKLIGNQ